MNIERPTSKMEIASLILISNQKSGTSIWMMNGIGSTNWNLHNDNQNN